ncbi:MAG: N-acetylmuramoyl-L-alanine amidase [Clostridia bacterium]|nr:N-acetylmuramoyl-L-alanine amidase [Clostridia bacterium]
MIEINKIPNQIIKERLQPLNLAKVDSIALHHMACDNDVKSIEQMHIQKGWRAIGYNYWVSFGGTIYEGRGLNLGAGVENQNGHIISIGFQGDYSKQREMPKEQFNSGIDIINWVLNKIPSIKKIGGHRDFMATACPGQYFPLEEMKKLKKREDGLTMTQYEELKQKINEVSPNYYDTINKCPDWSQKYVQKAVDMHILQGDEQGRLRLTDEKIWALVVILRTVGIMK